MNFLSLANGIFGKTIQLLKKPYPVEETKTKFFRTMFLVSVFVTFFLYVFKPFDISKIESGDFWICLGFGGMTILGSTVYELTVVRWLRLKSDSQKFTFGVWIFYLIGLMLFISFANFFYMRWYFKNIQWQFLPDMIYGTFAIGIFPTVVIGGLALLRQEKKYQTIAGEINQHQTPPQRISTLSEKSIFDIPIHQIKYIEALQNYVKIGHLNAAGQLVEKTERATLKGILAMSADSPIVKCHRSFLVNRDAIISTSGNAQGLLLHLSDCEKVIPVSRSFVSVFKKNTM